MELLDKLEERINTLLREMESVKDENRRLKENNQQELTRLAADNERLAEELERERSASQDVVRRLDALLEKLSDNTTDI